MMKVFAYIRYSSLNQKGNTTVETQRDAIVRFVATMPDLRGATVVERLDEAKSGTTVANRGALAAILREAAHGDSVVVFKYDRLGRNLLDSLQTLRGLEERGVHVYSTSEPNTEVVRNLLLTMAQEFSRQLGERCKRALDARAQAGHAANKPAYGYRIERETLNGPGKFVIVPDRANIVRVIFASRAKGMSFYEISKNLNTDGLKSPLGQEWGVATIRAILHNETYLGRVASGMRKFKKGHGLQGMRPRSEWIVCENAHEPIVTLDLWHTVRGFDSSKYVGRKATPKKQAQYLWTGFLRCRHCGANLMRSVSGKAYLGCDGGRKKGHRLPCQCRYLLHEDAVTQVVFGALVDQVYSADAIATLKSTVRREIERLTADTSAVVGPLETAVSKLQQKIEVATRRLVHVADDLQSGYIDELNKLKLERDKLKIQIAHARSLSASVPDPKQIDAKVDERLKALHGVSSCLDVADARAELSQHIDRIEVATDGQAWLYPKPDGLLAGLVDGYQGNGYIPTGI
jgi:site-specific DNA recombinase